MKEEDIKNLCDAGMSAAAIYKGALSVLKNSKDAERIVYLYFSASMFGNKQSTTMLLNMFGGDDKQ